jgi:hypothetical protein
MMMMMMIISEYPLFVKIYIPQCQNPLHLPLLLPHLLPLHLGIKDYSLNNVGRLDDDDDDDHYYYYYCTTNDHGS